ncbi:YicC family protein [Lewinellaceae bacterium SD302]|nr:YicC family protein [Lewinellaceae bacterium SD302]
MLLSMTGYGRATATHGDTTITVELRSLNSKYTDLRLRAPQNLQEKELELRKMVTDFAQRGKLEMNVEIKSVGSAAAARVDTDLLNSLFEQISEGAGGRLGDRSAPELYAALLRIPNVVQSADGALDDELWKALKNTTKQCLKNFQQYRQQEGEVMANDLASHASSINELLTQVAPHEKVRIGVVRERMERHLKDYMGRHNVDNNRYEQEVLFYLEKIDINEEQVRLKQNCDYFLEILSNNKETKGRKLSFISQEIGREVNTLGAKAYSAEIQKLVVMMKEHLEKIKEQLANVV